MSGRETRFADGVWLAVGTLSVVPAPMPRTVDRTVAGRAMALAPAVGLAVGGVGAAIVAGAGWLRPDAPLLAAALGLVALAALSGALHLDGLADTADGLGSRRDRDRMLAIMRTGDIGPFGVAAVALVLLVDAAALTACVTGGIGWQAVLVAALAGRTTLPWACRTTVPSARPDGLGAMVAGTVRARRAGAVTVVAAAAAVVPLLPQGGRAAVAGGSAVLVAAVAGALVVRRCVHELGGITGDVLGAAVEIGTAVALLVIALAA